MGIDARMMFKVRGEKPRDAQIAEWAWRLASAIGPKKFWLNADEDPPRRAIHLTHDCYREDGDAEPGKLYTQDGDDVCCDDDEWMLEVSLWGRYYGEGYERGDILTYCAIAEWLETNIPGATIFYGGDSSGVCLEPFDDARRRALRAHLYSEAGRDYFERGVDKTVGLPPGCALCIPGKPHFSQHGFGGNYAAVNCAGCGKSWEKRDGGPWVEKTDER